MKRFISLILATILLCQIMPIAAAAASEAEQYVYGAKSLLGSMQFFSKGITIEQKTEEGKTFIYCEAQPGRYTNGQIQCTYAPIDFYVGEYPVIKIGYRTNSHSPVVDFSTASSVTGESWLETKPSCKSDGNWNELYFDIRDMKGGGGVPPVNDFVSIVIKPFGSGTQVLNKVEHFDIEYIGCFKSLEEAQTYRFEGEDDYVLEVPEVEGFFWQKAANEDINKYLAEADALIQEIKNTPTDVEVKGTKYYVSASGSDHQNGKSPETAWRTIERVNKEALKSGDGVFFKRGESFRTEAELMTVAGVTYSAYGEGAKPMIVCSLDGSDPSMWKETEYKGIYKFEKKIADDKNVGTIVFDGGDAWGIQVQQTPNSKIRHTNGKVYNGLAFSDDSSMSGMKWSTLDKMLVNNLEFYHDWDTQTLYLYSPSGNPAEIFESVEITDKGHGISGVGTNVLIDNISIYGTGSHAIGYNRVRNLEIRNCEFHWIGGSIQGKGMFGRDIGVRYGNAVESYGDSENFKIHHNYASQIYDCCYTAQCQEGAKFDGIEIYNNVAEFCNTGLEVWNSKGIVKNMNLHDNYTRFSGYGFSHQRPTKDGNFFYGAAATTNEYENNHVTNNVNIFASAKALSVCATSESQYNFHDNIYFMENDKMIGGIAANPGLGLGFQVDTPYTEIALKKAASTGFEPGAKFYYTEPSPFENMYDLYKNFTVPVKNDLSLTKVFSDIPADFWGYKGIEEVYEKGYFGGVGNGKFAPDSAMNRAMLVTVLSRVSGAELGRVTAKPYTDVNTNEWYSASVDWAKRMGIVSADTDAFRPTDPATREEMADMLYKYACIDYKANIKGKTLSATDTDAVTPEYKDALIFCTDAGIITGFPSGEIKPKGEATRAQVATMITRFTEYMENAAVNEELIYENALKNAKIFTAKELYEAGILTGVGTEASVDGTSVKFTAAAGSYKNNDLSVNITPRDFALAEYPCVRVSYKTNSVATHADISARSTRAGESWLMGDNVIPELTCDGKLHDIFFNLNNMTGGGGLLRNSDKDATLVIKPLGKTVSFDTPKYFVLDKIVFCKNELEAKYIELN